MEAKTEYTGEARPAVANINGEALTLGAYLEGSLDEVKLWPSARSADQVAGDVHCPPYADIADLAFYLSMNHPPGYAGAIVAHSAACLPNSAAALGGTCLRWGRTSNCVAMPWRCRGGL